MLTGSELNLATKELSVLEPSVRNKLNEEYESEALAHYKVCRYPESNVWRRFHLEGAERVRPLSGK